MGPEEAFSLGNELQSRCCYKDDEDYEKRTKQLNHAQRKERVYIAIQHVSGQRKRSGKAQRLKRTIGLP
jgi:hypothetical protein